MGHIKRQCFIVGLQTGRFLHPMRLSLESISWTHRILAVAFALLVALVLLGPISLLVESVATGDLRVLMGIPAAIGFFLLFSALSPLLLLGVVLCWVVPALLVVHALLWLRCNLLVFMAAGAATGVLGFAMFDGAVIPIAQGLWFSVAATGSLAATAAYWFMWVGLNKANADKTVTPDSGGNS